MSIVHGYVLPPMFAKGQGLLSPHKYVCDESTGGESCLQVGAGRAQTDPRKDHAELVGTGRAQTDPRKDDAERLGPLGRGLTSPLFVPNHLPPHLVAALSYTETTALLGPRKAAGGRSHASVKPSLGWPFILRGSRPSTRTSRQLRCPFCCAIAWIRRSLFSA